MLERMSGLVRRDASSHGWCVWHNVAVAVVVVAVVAVADRGCIETSPFEIITFLSQNFPLQNIIDFELNMLALIFVARSQ